MLGFGENGVLIPQSLRDPCLNHLRVESPIRASAASTTDVRGVPTLSPTGLSTYNGEMKVTSRLTTSDTAFVSLFSGCGGFDLGLVQAGLRPVAAFDNDSAALSTHRASIGCAAHLTDLAEQGDSLAEYVGVDVVIAGPPCQGFSTAGKRRTNDARNHFVPLAATIAASLRPEFFVLENVPAARSGSHQRYWRKAERILANAGYRLHEVTCRADNMGVAQRRQRVFLIAGPQSIELDLEPPMSNSEIPTLRDALNGSLNSLPNHEPRWPDCDSLAASIAPHIKPGQKLSNVRLSQRSVHTWNIPEVFGQTDSEEREVLKTLVRYRRTKRRRSWGDADPVPTSRLETTFGEDCLEILMSLLEKEYVRQPSDGYWDLTRTFNGKYRRLCWDQPSPTVHTKFGDPHYFLHPDEDRGLTVREAARIQGFPDDFCFHGSLREQYRQVGNAVPPPVARWIGTVILGGKQ